jgi:hypothetical protein
MVDENRTTRKRRGRSSQDSKEKENTDYEFHCPEKIINNLINNPENPENRTVTFAISKESEGQLHFDAGPATRDFALISPTHVSRSSTSTLTKDVELLTKKMQLALIRIQIWIGVKHRFGKNRNRVLFCYLLHIRFYKFSNHVQYVHE